MNEGSLDADTVELVRSGSTASTPLTKTTNTNADGGTVLKLDPFGPTAQKLGKVATQKLTVEGAGDADGFAVKDASSNEMAKDKTSSLKTRRR